MTTTLGSRMATLGICVVLLGGLFVLAGAEYPTHKSSAPDLADPDVSPDHYAGEYIEIGGEVIATDPVIIEIGDGTSTQQLPVENAPDVRIGQEVIVDGTLTTDGTLVVNLDRAVVREPWETTYMYAISVLAVLGVAGRGIDGWQLNRDTYTVTPRETPLHLQYLGDHTSDDQTDQRTDNG